MNEKSLDAFAIRYQKLNDAQKKAVDTIEGPVLVVAGPVSGHPELLSLRVANILQLTDATPSSLLCLTFTDAAAANMRKRLAGLIGSEAYRVNIATFHSFGSEIIHQYPEYFHDGAFYNPADELTRIAIMEEIFAELKHNSPFKSYHPDQGYTYLKDVITKIGELKKGGLSPQEFKHIIDGNKTFLDQVAPLLAHLFDDRVSTKTLVHLKKLREDIEKISIPKLTALPYQSLQETITQSLALALEKAEAGEKIHTKPLTEWKNLYTRKNIRKETVFKDAVALEKHLALAEVYKKYQDKLKMLGYFDFEDMLMETVTAMEKHADLRFNLQEKYLYVLVDEFQDTNGIQMRLLHTILNMEVTEGRPNILVVGDDDQAIYKFQGANIENILTFHARFKDPEIIVLRHNYRSHQNILDFVRKIILQGNDRLEKLQPDIVFKDLLAAQESPLEGSIYEKEFPTAFHEMVAVGEEVQRLLKEGTPAEEIAIIAPKHNILRTMAKVLDHYKIPVSYLRRKNLFEEPHLHELLTMLIFIDSILQKGQSSADELLPEILSFSFWGLKRLDIWRVAVEAHRRRARNLWLEVMLESENEKIQDIAKFFIILAGEAKEKNAEEMIDYLTGVKSIDIDEQDKEQVGQLIRRADFTSPYKDFYFSEEHFKEEPAAYLNYLNALKSFMQKIRAYKNRTVLQVHNVVEFVELHQKHKLPLFYEDELYKTDRGVNLLTAHGAKGLEFDTVFIISTEDETWMSKGMVDKLHFPSNVPLEAEADTREDKLRLFYVALTRAKRNLFLYRHQYNDKGNSLARLRFLEDSEFLGSKEEKAENISLDTVQTWQKELEERKGFGAFMQLRSDVDQPTLYTLDETDLLKNQLKSYKLSVTHLIKFLDVINGGPYKFVMENLLRFPQKKMVASAYGSAMHRAIDRLLVEYKVTKKLPDVNFLLQEFEKALLHERLNAKDFAEKLEQGREHLALYYEKRHHDFRMDDKSEFNFAQQGVVVGSAEITGKIDKIRMDQANKELIIYDYKTGKGLYSWQGHSDYEHLKLWRYKNQLLFYKLLVENSREFKGKYTVKKGAIEFLDPMDKDILLLPLDLLNEDVEVMKQLIQTVFIKIKNLDLPDISGYEKNMYGIQSFMDDLLSNRT